MGGRRGCTGIGGGKGVHWHRGGKVSQVPWPSAIGLTSMLACPLTVQGRVFMDRSGTLFDEVLSLLRDGPEWGPPEDRCVPRRQLRAMVCMKGGEGGERGGGGEGSSRA